MSASRHHYVPQWYQRRFLPPGETRLHYVDKRPFRIIRGRRIETSRVRLQGPSKCFAEPNLYGVRLDGLPVDAFESIFFGEVDRLGARAVAALGTLEVGGWLREEDLLAFFNFLSIQQLRTVQGMDWLIANYKVRDRTELMRLLAGLQHMRCAMWAEAHHQILVAPEGGPGFIISDSPVTFFNKACYPGSRECRYPNYPSPRWKGTQTIFPLDPRKCVVLTHLEFANKPTMELGLKRDRTNARDFGETIMRVDDFQHRDISGNDVLKVNFLLQVFARRYCAAPQLSWIEDVPRMGKNPQWPKLGAPLFPVDADPLKYGGTTYVGYDDGRVLKQDEFGRRPKTLAEQELAEREAKEIRDHLEQVLANEKRKDVPGDG